ncbi:MAG: hypothetical protein AAF721_23680 [Myxococcota bacterium]
MRNLTLHDVKLALRELLDNRSKVLTGTHAGAMFLPAIENIRRKIDELHVRDDGDDLTTELAHEDAIHDGYAAAAWFASESYLALPDLPFGDRVALKMLRREILPPPHELSAPYADEAAKAVARAEAMSDEHRDALRRFPVRGEKTLLDWIEAYIASGKRLQRLLSQRAMAEQTGEVAVSPLQAGRLRGRAVALLIQLRETLKYELHAETQRARELDKQVFHFVDKLSTARQTSRDDWADETFLYSDDASRNDEPHPEDTTQPIMRPFKKD